MTQLRGLQAGYPGRPVLEGVDLDLLPGEVLALLGPNGCGKSTLLRAACGLLPRTGGEILAEGRPIGELSTRQLARHFAYLPQSRAVPSITARRMVLHGRFPYLDFPRRYRREDYEAVDRALEQVGGSELAERFLPQLSGGQRQKVYLAMALAQDTPVILMDEPTTYLDVRCQLETMELARRLEGKSPANFPRETAMGALALYISDQSVVNFQPMNINFGLIPPLGYRVKGKRNKNAEISRRALEALETLDLS